MKRAPYQRSRQTRQKLLDAVIQLAREKTYEAISVQDICRRAGVSTGSFYHQFGSKVGLLGRMAAALARVRVALAERGPHIPITWANRNWKPYVKDVLAEAYENGHRNVLVLVNSASTGQTFSQAKECVEYYGGRATGFAALFSNIGELAGKKVVSLFSGEDFPHYQNFVRGKACPDCAAGVPLDAIVTPRGYNKL